MLSALTKAIALASVSLACSVCSAADQTQPLERCQPEPIARPTVEPSAAFWRAHPQAHIDVVIRLKVAPDGSVADVTVLPGEFGSDYVTEVTKAVRKWRFEPFSCAPSGLWLGTRLRFVGPDVTI